MVTPNAVVLLAVLGVGCVAPAVAQKPAAPEPPMPEVNRAVMPALVPDDAVFCVEVTDRMRAVQPLLPHMICGLVQVGQMRDAMLVQRVALK